MTVSRILHATEFSVVAHAGQTRRYMAPVVPYVTHPLAVAQIVADAVPDSNPDKEDMIIAAILHDVVEDTDVGIDVIHRKFGWLVAGMVDDLTKRKVAGESRAEHKASERLRLLHVRQKSKTVKLADIAHNVPSIIMHDPKLAKVYVHEIQLLLPSLIGGDVGLWGRVDTMVRMYFRAEGLGHDH